MQKLTAKDFTPDNLRAIRQHWGLSIPKAATAIGISRVSWWRWEEQGVPVPDELVWRLELLASKGPEESKKAIETGAQPSFADAVATAKDANSEVLVPILPTLASAGPGMDPGVETPVPTGHIGFAGDYLRNQFGTSAPSALVAVHVEGDSMEPTLKNGETVLVERLDSPSLRDGIFLLGIEESLLLKRLAPLPGGRVEVRSDNPTYASYQVDLRQENHGLRLFGRVVAVLRRL